MKYRANILSMNEKGKFNPLLILLLLIVLVVLLIMQAPQGMDITQAGYFTVFWRNISGLVSRVGDSLNSMLGSVAQSITDAFSSIRFR